MKEVAKKRIQDEESMRKACVKYLERFPPRDENTRRIRELEIRVAHLEETHVINVVLDRIVALEKEGKRQSDGH